MQFVRLHIVKGRTLGLAFLEAFPELTAHWSTRDKKIRMQMAGNAGCNLIKKPQVAEYVLEVQEKLKRDAERSQFLTFEEKRAFLAAVLRTPIEEIDESSPLAQEVTYMADGSRKVKSPCKHKAAELDARLMGEFQDTVRLDLSEKIIKMSAEVV